MAPQNIYDDPNFFAGYAQLPRVKEGLDAVYEWPAFQRMLPPSLTDYRVLDLGCGMGYFAREARARGAQHVVGVDLSQRMLQRASEYGNDSGIIYIRSSLETFEPEEAAFDLVVSMLALHYIADYRVIVKRVARCLKPGGRFALSVEHPIYTANDTGAWNVASDGSLTNWPVDRYRDEGERRRHWFVDDVLRYHRTVETYVNTILDTGLVLVRLEEPEADPLLLAQRPALQQERRRPPFLLLAADRH